MILLRSHILGFGKLQNRILEFQNGLNVVFAANEGGKSTLQRFLMALLYGQLRSDLKIQRRLDPWVDQYKPWYAQEYGGVLWCRLADGREIEIHRYFGKDETRIEIRTSSGEDITRKYEQQRNGEVLFARSHFGMPKELFESVGVIRENRVAEIHGYETIRDRIANLAQSGDEELSIRQSLATIQEKLESIGSERAPTKPYKQALDLVQNLQNERKAVEERRLQFQGWLEERNRLAGEVSTLEREFVKAQSALLSARRREMAGKIQTLEEIQNEILELRNDIEMLNARADFPSERLEELDQLVGARESTAKHLGEIRNEKDAALALLSKAESQRRVLAPYAELAKGTEAEKITEWFVSYLSISLQRDGLQKTINRLGEEASVLEKSLGELSPVFANAQTDWERSAREAAEDEQISSQNCTAITERIAVQKSHLAAVNSTTSNRRLIGIAILGVAVASVLPFVIDLTGFPSTVHIGVGAILVVAAVIMFVLSTRSGKSSNQIKEMLRNFEEELKSIREEGSRKRRAFNETMKDSGFDRIDDFLAAAKRSEQDRQRLAELQTRIQEAEHQRERLQVQSNEIYQQLKEGLANVGLSCSPGNLKFQIDLLRSNLRRFRELDAEYVARLQNSESLKTKDTELTVDHEQKCLSIQSLLDAAQVETPEQFREECSKRRRLMELLERESSRNREFSRLAGALTLDEWKDQYGELMRQKDPQSEAQMVTDNRTETGNSAPFLPYFPTIAEAEEQEKASGSQLAAVREEYARAVERVSQAFQNCRPAYEIDEDLSAAEQTLGGLEKNRLALEMALDILEKLSRQQQEVLAPQLNAAVEQRFLKLCAGRYEEVKIDPDFQIWVREVCGTELRLAEHLSRGTQDQLYFSMRFGIMDLVSNADEPCPGFLDEPFAAYDQTRLRQAFDVLREETGHRQVVLFTCREDLLDLAVRHQANIVRLGE